MHPVTKNFATILRPWMPSDKEAVWQVLKDGSYSNVNAAFKICLQKSLAKVFGAVLVAIGIGNGHPPLIIALYLIIFIGLIYCICLLGTVIYLYGPNFKDIEDISHTYFNNQNHHFWVAECQGEIVGTIAIVRKISSLPGSPDNNSTEDIEQISKVAWLRRMAVKRSHRGKGIAKLLVLETIKFCQDKNYSSIFLITTEVHHAARELYNRMGFQLVACRPYKYFHGLVTVQTFEYVLNL
uniref:N-acetyltransferase domain-containing protein n=1 Tax=Biomphalaria glabrata TaxID=6526 RepID=A0A2C9M682_BIOGL